MNRNFVVISVYGDSPVYQQGVVENARLLPEVYPGWGMIVYCDKCVPVEELGELGCEVRRMPLSRKHSGMFWRFLAAWDSGLDRVIFRDADSRLNVREAAAVREWIQSGKEAHCLHDHPHHSHLPLQGGMWGIKTGFLSRRTEMGVKERCRRPQPRVADMKFLRSHVYPEVSGSILRHSSVRVPWESVPFPEHEPYDGFVGQQHNEEGVAIWP